ncbi:MAG: carboxypeptidase regulatory-like domain-containing protein [Deltaproteobacteria bacterium]|nr:carboxypeptidase regulatory-like domain-containing protein [Deltaproteobacteria bacterium]
MIMRACRWTYLIALASPLASGCFEPTNPCDPSAPPEVRSQGTRITGTVVDQDRNVLAGVPVTISGRSDTQVSAENGTFTFENLTPGVAYELVALPSAPMVGGRVRTSELQCLSSINDVDVVVVVPPQSPELEMVRATSESRLFVAFGGVEADAELRLPGIDTFYEGNNDEGTGGPRDAWSVNADCAERADRAPFRYRVQLRAPFDEWRDARLSAFPWIDPMQLNAAVTAGERSAGDYTLPGVDDVCAAALCARYGYLESSLLDNRARCAEVVGVVTVDDDGVENLEPLTPYGSYQVRVRTELRTNDDQRARYTLPERILAAAPTLPSQMSLLPGALLPVVNGNGEPRAVGNVTAVQPTAGGRFALVDGDWIALIGDGADVLDDEAERAVGDGAACQGALGSDDSCEQAMAGDMTGDIAPTASIEPLAVLPSGSWLRVMRRSDDGVATPGAAIKKVYVGTDATSALEGPTVDAALANAIEPAMSFDAGADEAGSALRAFRYLNPPDAALVDDGINPPDAYVLVYRSALVLMEQGAMNTMALRFFTTADAVEPTSGRMGGGWAAGADELDASAGLGGDCAALESVGEPSGAFDDGIIGQRRVSLCYDVGAALGESVDLRDFDKLPGEGGATFLIADGANDRLLAASEEALTCAGCAAGAITPLASQLSTVRVGREPVALLRTHTVDCSTDPVPRPVILVANHGSGDLSMVKEEAGELRETAVVPLPALPASFLEDPAGPTCDDPFIWVIADDGQVIPVDMRGEPSVPVCGDTACALGTRGRGAVGGVQRRRGDAPGAGRALIGGPGLLGEIGFFRPQALPGAAYAGQAELEGVGAEPAP